MNHFYQTSDKFSAAFRCYSIAMMQGSERENVNHGGKIILPPSALAKLSNLHIEYPMLFRLENKKENAATHAGVLEFIAEEGRVYLPRWMMSTLMVEEGQLISVENTSLALGKFVKIQPQSVNFLDISDPKAVLEQAFRHFACLTQGDIISISYNDTLYEILVMETKPSEKGISIIETDLEVDFAAPLGYIEPEYKPTKLNDPLPSSSIAEHTIRSAEEFASFNGSGNRLNGKQNTVSYGHPETSSSVNQSSGVAEALILPKGKLYFGYPVIPLRKEGDEEEEVRFSGVGQSLRSSRTKRKGKGKAL